MPATQTRKRARRTISATGAGRTLVEQYRGKGYFNTDGDMEHKIIAKANDQLVVACPAGIGDFIWVWSKLWVLTRFRSVLFAFPDGEQHRAGQYAALVGAQATYLPGIRTEMIWDMPGAPEIPGCGGFLFVQANRHLEAGRPLRDWYPDLPLQYPKTRLAKADPIESPFVLAFLGPPNYMGGQLNVKEWAEAIRHVEKTIAPVRFVGAAKDVPFAKRVERAMRRNRKWHLFDREIAAVLAAARNRACRAAFGMASGPLIAILCEGCPTMFGYPDHILQMPGTWEPPYPWDWCHSLEMDQCLLDGALERIAR